MDQQASARQDKSRLLLISNSKSHGGGYLDHCEEAIRSFLGPVKSILFFPYALKDHDGCTEKARERFGRMGIELTSVHEIDWYRLHEAITTQAHAFFVGGGNTFCLLSQMLVSIPGAGGVPHCSILNLMRGRIGHGVPYIGTSAGANLACPTIKTTNDMPIKHVPTFDALQLVPFQINPHYVDADPNSTHQGETRERRLKEFHEENETPVVGLREGAWLRVEAGITHLEGANGAKLFRRGQEPLKLGNGVIESSLLVV